MLKMCQMEYDCQRLTRIAEGCQVVHSSTEEECAHIIARFHIENTETPLRQELYRSAVAATGSGSMSIDSDANKRESVSFANSFSSTVPPIPEEQELGAILDKPRSSISGQELVDPPKEMDSEDETAVFIREMDLALKLSLEDHEKHHR